MLKKLSALLAVALVAGPLFAQSQGPTLPFIDDPISVGDFKDLDESVMHLLPGMSRDLLVTEMENNFDVDHMPKLSEMMTSPAFRPEVVYFPWTRLMIITNPSNPAMKSFGFAYTRKGALLAATVRATTDWDALKSQLQSYEGRLGTKLIVKPLPVRSGTFYPTMVFKDGSSVTLGLTTNPVSQANPRGETALNYYFNKEMADLVAAGLQTGAAVGWNYTYKVPVAITPFKAMIEINWAGVMEYTKTSFAMRSSVTTVQMEEAVRKMKKKGIINIQIMSGDDHKTAEAAIWDVAKIVLARAFNPQYLNPEDGAQQTQLPPNPGRDLSTHVATGSFPGIGGAIEGFTMINSGGTTSSYSKKKITDVNLEQERIILVSSPYKEVEFSAGIQVGGLCDINPELFVYEGENRTLHKGCPSALLPDVTQEITQTMKPATNVTLSTGVPRAEGGGMRNTRDDSNSVPTSAVDELRNGGLL